MESLMYSLICVCIINILIFIIRKIYKRLKAYKDLIKIYSYEFLKKGQLENISKAIIEANVESVLVSENEEQVKEAYTQAYVSNFIFFFAINTAERINFDFKSNFTVKDVLKYHTHKDSAFLQSLYQKYNELFYFDKEFKTYGDINFSNVDFEEFYKISVSCRKFAIKHMN